MKTIENLTVKVTYTAGLGNVKIPNNIYDAMTKIYNNGGEVPNPDVCCINGQKELACISEWLADHIKENDAMDWECQIVNITD